MSSLFFKVEKLLKRLKLQPKVAVDETALVDDRYFLIIPCQDKNGQKWLLKIQYLGEPTPERNFLNEVNFLKLAQKYPQVAAHVPLMKDFGHLEGKIWCLREFIEGQLLGKDDDTFPYEAKILSRLDPQVVVGFFQALTQIPLKKVLPVIPRIKRHDLTWRAKDQKFLEDHPSLFKLKEKKMEYFSKEEQERLFHLLCHPPRAILSPTSWALNHSNLYSTNILFSPSRNLVFIDWETVGWGLRASDLGEFWLHSFTLPKFQTDFFQACLKTAKRKEEFLAGFYFAFAVGSAPFTDYLISLYQKGKMEKRTYERIISIFSQTIREGMKFFRI